MTKVCWLMLAMVAAAGCKAPNEAFCCLTLEECLEHGVEGETRPCDDGLACKENACVAASCSMDGCAATAPTCDTASDVCVGCTDSAECSRFPDSNMCDAATGSCVECLTTADCGVATEPVCDAGSCRRCARDSECMSGACADDGSCVAPEQIVYLHPDGNDTGDCTLAMPCKTFVVAKTSPTRNHFVLAPGVYASGLYADSTRTTATSLAIHGGGASVNYSGDGYMFGLSLPTSVRDLNLFSGSGTGISVDAPCIVERVNIKGTTGMRVASNATLRAVNIEPSGTSIVLTSGSLTADGVVLRGGQQGISGGDGVAVNLTNVLVYDTSEVAIDLPGTSSTGSMSFITLADTGTGVDMGTTGVSCGSSNVTIRSSIVWASRSSAFSTPLLNCTVATTTIAGPYGGAIPNVMNVDPKFVNPVARDYHLTPASPAKDLAEAGPPIDFEGDPRPLEGKFDLGADEVR